jgi:hypothetical protein
MIFQTDAPLAVVYPERIEDAGTKYVVLLAASPRRSGRLLDDPADAHNFLVAELLPGQVEIETSRQAIPIMTAHTSGPGMDVGSDEPAADEFFQHKRGDPALSARRVIGAPFAEIFHIAGVPAPGVPDDSFQSG